MATHRAILNSQQNFQAVFTAVRFLLILGLSGLTVERSSVLLAQSTDFRTESPRKMVLCSTTQIADFTARITGDRWEVICVLAAGQDPHTYEVGHNDLLHLMRADLCIENGWNLEGNNWMRVLAETGGKPLITCVDNIIPLNIKGPGNDPRSRDRVIKDPHAWFDVQRAIEYVRNICDGIVSIDPEHRAEYQLRSENYILELRSLDCWIREQVNAIPRNRRVLVTHHDGFGYFCEAYGFRSITPVGWSTGEFTEVTIDQRQLIIHQIRQLGVKSIFVETSINRNLLTGIARDAGVTIGGELYSDAMGPSGSAEDHYIGMMRYNVQTIVGNLK
jgi:manganese/iron transport system substrate-binding protein